MIDPHVEHGGASSWFCIAENFDAVGLTGAEAPVLRVSASGLAIAATSSVNCSGVVASCTLFTPARYCASGDRNFAAIHRKM